MKIIEENLLLIKGVKKMDDCFSKANSQNAFFKMDENLLPGMWVKT